MTTESIKTNKFYHIGIEGGATKTTGILVSNAGQIIAKISDKASNPFVVGFENVQNLLIQMIETLIELGSQQSEINPDFAEFDQKSVKSVGLCMSGGDSKEVQEKLTRALAEKFTDIFAPVEQPEPSFTQKFWGIMGSAEPEIKPKTYKNLVLCTDTHGSIATNCEKAGIVLIAGTGSNCLLVDNQGQASKRCGGWGHLFGDEGSGFSISRRAMQLIYHKTDNFICDQTHAPKVQEMNWYKLPNHAGIKLAEAEMYKYFNCQTRDELVSYMYPPKFDKAFFAGFCQILVKLAQEQNDEFSKFVFEEAGCLLARHILSFGDLLISEFGNAAEKTTNVNIVCEGSVWNAYSLLQPGFEKILKTSKKEGWKIKDEVCGV